MVGAAGGVVSLGRVVVGDGVEGDKVAEDGGVLGVVACEAVECAGLGLEGGLRVEEFIEHDCAVGVQGADLGGQGPVEAGGLDVDDQQGRVG